jgi:hypothetical protein
VTFEWRCRRSMVAMAEDWAATDARRMLHAVYRVGDLPGTIKFYKEQLGMQVG